MSFKVLGIDNTKKWNECLQRLPKEQQDIYYTPEYYSLYENLGDGKAQCFLFQKDGELALYPFLINSVNKLGYKLNDEYFDIQGAYGYNGVVASSYNPDFITAFYLASDAWCQQNSVIAEFTRFHPLLNNHLFSNEYFQIIFDRKTIFIDLRQGYNELIKNYQRTTRKQISRATRRYQLRIERHINDPDCVDIFYPIYQETMDRAKAEKYLYFDRAYFQKLLSTTPSTCFVVMDGEEPIASIIAFYNEYYLHGHLGGALTKNLEMSPTSFLYDHLIKYGIEKSCSYFHVGGGRTTTPDDALLNFKTNFSNQAADFFIGKKVHNPIIYNEVIEQWENANSEKAEKYKHHILKYRY
jgi:hypothetical protein